MVTLNFQRFVIGVINFVFGFIIFGLILRFFFRLIGASPTADFVEFLYNSTNPLLQPFRGMFQPYVIEDGSVLEFTTLVAIILYMIAAWLLVEFVLFITYNAKRTYKR